MKQKLLALVFGLLFSASAFATLTCPSGSSYVLGSPGNPMIVAGTCHFSTGDGSPCVCAVKTCQLEGCKNKKTGVITWSTQQTCVTDVNHTEPDAYCGIDALKTSDAQEDEFGRLFINGEK